METGNKINNPELRFCIFGQDFQAESLPDDILKVLTNTWRKGDLRLNGKSRYNDGGAQISKFVDLDNLSDEIVVMIDCLFKKNNVELFLEGANAYFSISVKGKSYSEFFLEPGVFKLLGEYGMGLNVCFQSEL